MLLSILTQLSNVPDDYSVTYLRRPMAIHLVDHVTEIYVSSQYSSSMYNNFPQTNVPS